MNGAANCPNCRVPLEPDSRWNAHQCYIAYAAWIDMNGDRNRFPKPIGECCGKLGIACFLFKIAIIDWDHQGLSGPISPKLKHLPQLEQLYYELFYLIINEHSRMPRNSLSEGLDILESFTSIGILESM